MSEQVKIEGVKYEEKETLIKRYGKEVHVTVGSESCWHDPTWGDPEVAVPDHLLLELLNQNGAVLTLLMDREKAIELSDAVASWLFYEYDLRGKAKLALD